MASTYTSTLRLQIQASGENNSTWGDITSANLQSIEEAIAGYLSIGVGGSGDTTLTATNSGIGTATDQSRNAILNLTGALTANNNVVIPNASKQYWINNATTGAFTLSMKTAGGAGAALPAGFSLAYCDASNNVTVQTPISLNGVQTLTNKTLTSPVITTPSITGGSAVNLTMTTPQIGGGLASGLTLTSPNGVVTNVNFAAGNGVTLTGNTAINSAGTVTIAASTGSGTVSSVGFTAGSGISLTGNTSITSTGAVTIASTAGGGSVTGVTFHQGTGIALTGNTAITTAGTVTIATSGGSAGTLNTGNTNTKSNLNQGTSTQAHGLGSTPAFVAAWLECTTTDGNFSVGNRVGLGLIAQPASNPASDGGVSVSYDSTNTVISIVGGGADFVVPERSVINPGLVNLTSNRWKAVAVPYTVN